ncbi:hypothetical protein [Azospirillum sp. ST 5-10]|uniref:hypothetical protein n=1 Tax=unclassified Azospirillum TaxID=2630922 RepID=UPI003F49E016
MLEDPFASLSFIAGPAILTNACAILQNGATTRYNLAITQWREFRASVVAHDDRISRQYVAPEAAVALAGRRVRLQLRGLAFLNTAVALFAAATLVGLVGAVLVQVRGLPAEGVALTMAACGTAALLALLGATATFFFESACGGALLRLHRERADGVGTGSR